MIANRQALFHSLKVFICLYLATKIQLHQLHEEVIILTRTFSTPP